jgi:hypothetical protein
MHVAAWYDEYVAVFAACGRGQQPVESALDYYAVPLTITTPTTVGSLTTSEAVVAFVQSQVDGMLASRYHHSVVLDGDETPVSPTTTILRRRFSRQRQDGSEISELTVTYVVTTQDGVRRIASLFVHA